MMMILAPSATVTRAGAIANPTLDGAEAMKSSAINSANNSPTTISFERYKKTMRGAFSRSFDQGSYVFRQVDLGESSRRDPPMDHHGLGELMIPDCYGRAIRSTSSTSSHRARARCPVSPSATCHIPPRVTVRHVSP